MSAREPIILLLSGREGVRSRLASFGPVRVEPHAPGEPRAPALIVADFCGDHGARVDRRVQDLLRPGDAVLGLLEPNGYRPEVYLDRAVEDEERLPFAAQELARLVALESEIEVLAALRTRIQAVVRDPVATSLMERLLVEHMELHKRLQAQLERRTLELLRAKQELEASLDERRATQAQLLQAGKLAAVGQLAAGLAHEINNPLAVILGFAQGLQDQVPPGDDLRAPVDAVVREALRCRALIRDLLAFSRPDPGLLPAVDPTLILERAARLLEARARAQGTRCRLDCSQGPAIRASATQIEQVILNLGNNALDALGTGGEIVLRSRPSEGGVRLEVADTGPGIPPEIAAHLFEPFFTTKEVGQGTGLGLSLAYSIVVHHGGRIDVETHPGTGTTFVVWLPGPSPSYHPD